MKTRIWADEEIEYLCFVRVTILDAEPDLWLTRSLPPEAINYSIRTRQYRALLHLIDFNDTTRPPSRKPVLDREPIIQCNAYILAANEQDITSSVCHLRSNSGGIPADNAIIRTWAFDILPKNTNKYRQRFGKWLQLFLALIPSNFRDSKAIFPPVLNTMNDETPSRFESVELEASLVLASELEEICQTTFLHWSDELGYHQENIWRSHPAVRLDPLDLEPGRHKLPYSHMRSDEFGTC